MTEPNISPWRRAVCGDLTSAFDFTRPAAHPAQLISTAGYRARADEEVRTLPEPTPPRVEGTLMPQEPGTRPACPLPYALEVDFVPGEGGGMTLRFANTGTARCFPVCLSRGEHRPALALHRWRRRPAGGDTAGVLAATGSLWTERVLPRFPAGHCGAERRCHCCGRHAVPGTRELRRDGAAVGPDRQRLWWQRPPDHPFSWPTKRRIVGYHAQSSLV